MFNSIIPSTGITTLSALYCCAASILLGIVIAVVYMIKNTYTKSFVTGLCLLPLIVQVVIMMVNGNIGTGVAIVGAFSLIRFRSFAGSTKEIVTVFWAMAVGLHRMVTCLLRFHISCIVVYLESCTSFGEKKTSTKNA